VVTAQLDPVQGAARIAQLLVDVTGLAPGLTILERSVNGRPGVIAQLDGATVVVMALHVEHDRITNLWAVRNPDKLRPWT
jgi:RNA polymerase sigma-70 factor (ECF subfamily)